MRLTPEVKIAGAKGPNLEETEIAQQLRNLPSQSFFFASENSHLRRKKQDANV
jgi:hypothetical protein